MTVYLKLAGTKTGAVKGGVTAKGHEGTIGVVAVHQATASAPPATRAVPEPLVLTKRLDRASPLLEAMVATGEACSQFVLEVWLPQAEGTGAEVKTYTIELTGAVPVAMAFDVADQLDPILAKRPPTETLRFSYRKISWTWADGGITASAGG